MPRRAVGRPSDRLVLLSSCDGRAGRSFRWQRAAGDPVTAPAFDPSAWGGGPTSGPSRRRGGFAPSAWGQRGSAGSVLPVRPSQGTVGPEADGTGVPLVSSNPGPAGLDGPPDPTPKRGGAHGGHQKRGRRLRRRGGRGPGAAVPQRGRAGADPSLVENGPSVVDPRGQVPIGGGRADPGAPRQGLQTGVLDHSSRSPAGPGVGKMAVLRRGARIMDLCGTRTATCWWSRQWTREHRQW